jgi:hypothetical protein
LTKIIKDMVEPAVSFVKMNRIGEDEQQLDLIDARSISSYLQSDFSMTLEGQIADIQDQINEYLPLVDYFRVGTQKFNFDDKDPIFMANGPNKKKEKTETCAACAKVVFKTDAERIFCQFCGTNNCKECCLKKRNYPKANLGIDGKVPRGDICVVCDRKFLVRANFISDKATFHKKQVKDKNLQAEIKELESQI